MNFGVGDADLGILQVERDQDMSVVPDVTIIVCFVPQRMLRRRSDLAFGRSWRASSSGRQSKADKRHFPTVLLMDRCSKNGSGECVKGLYLKLSG